MLQIRVEVPYKRLGVGKETTPFRCECVRDKLLPEFADEWESCESILATYDTIMVKKASHDFRVYFQSFDNSCVSVLHVRVGGMQECYKEKHVHKE